MIARGMARDRPSPYGFPLRFLLIVARGPVPRDRSVLREHGEGQALALRFGKGSVLREHGEGQALALQFPRRFPPIVARGPVPRDRSVLREHGEGQALALRFRKGSVLRERGEGQALALQFPH